MSEKNTNFDKVIERRGTDCLKYDFAVKRGKPAKVLPLWVADMDFKTSSYVTEALSKRAEHGIFGYTESTEEYFKAVAGWMERHHGFKVEEDWLVKTPGVVFAIAMAIKAFTKEGDAVLIQQPVYYPFSEVIRDNGRKIVSNDLVLGEDNRYHIDFEDFEKKIVENDVHLFILCSPHNPVGRVWTYEELKRVGDICIKHKVLVVSDEIHEDFVFGKNKHQVFANIEESFKNNSITCTSPGKTFNLAGVQVSNIFIPNEALRAAFKKQIDAAGYSQLNSFGIEACKIAYTFGDEWYEKMISYIENNIKYFREFIEKELPILKVIEQEGTYLSWVDFSGLNYSHNELEDLIVKDANLWLDSGAIFGKAGAGFERFNLACPLDTLKQALNQLKTAIKNKGF